MCTPKFWKDQQGGNNFHKIISKESEGSLYVIHKKLLRKKYIFIFL